MSQKIIEMRNKTLWLKPFFFQFDNCLFNKTVSKEIYKSIESRDPRSRAPHNTYHLMILAEYKQWEL
ncbi:hypothetical protein QTP88_010654 [Uroleucon formosanum]